MHCLIQLLICKYLIHTSRSIKLTQSFRTDNYYSQSSRETFIVTSANKLYSVTNNAYYYRESTTSGGKLFWSTTASTGDSLFYSTYNATIGYNQLFMRTAAGATTNYVFCVYTIAANNGNSASGSHVWYSPNVASNPVNCTSVNLFLQPT